jgi:hypothetical protein
MISKKDFAIVVLSVASGFGGGMLSMKSHVVEAADHQTIRATRFELVDASGKSIAFWGTDQDDQLIIAFTGGTQSELAAFGLLSGLNGGLRISGIDATPRATLLVGYHERPSLSLYDEKGRGRVGLGFVTSHTPGPEEVAHDAWALEFYATGQHGHREQAAIGYSKAASGLGWDGSIFLEDSKGKTWKAP